jgi:hypothetical protein
MGRGRSRSRSRRHLRGGEFTLPAGYSAVSGRLPRMFRHAMAARIREFAASGFPASC